MCLEAKFDRQIATRDHDRQWLLPGAMHDQVGKVPDGERGFDLDH